MSEQEQLDNSAEVAAVDMVLKPGISPQSEHQSSIHSTAGYQMVGQQVLGYSTAVQWLENTCTRSCTAVEEVQPTAAVLSLSGSVVFSPLSACLLSQSPSHNCTVQGCVLDLVHAAVGSSIVVACTAQPVHTGKAVAVQTGDSAGQIGDSVEHTDLDDYLNSMAEKIVQLYLSWVVVHVQPRPTGLADQ